MDKKRFARLLERDKGCVHCGEVEAVSPHHRLNRGMGGSKLRDVASNIVVMCSRFNFLMESDSKSAELGRKYGWKLRPWDEPANTPVYFVMAGQWYLLDDEYKKHRHGGSDG
jgi:hypothetical protein